MSGVERSATGRAAGAPEGLAAFGETAQFPGADVRAEECKLSCVWEDDVAQDRERGRRAPRNMKRTLSLLLAAMLLGAAAPSGGASTGAEIVQHSAALGFVPCMACHGSSLQGNVSIGAPALAGLAESVTLPALAAIADGKLGNNVVMQNIARTLSDSERRGVALYLAGLKPAKHPLNVVIAGGALLSSSQIVELSTGAEIVQSGTASGAMPCMTCHGAHLQGNASIGAPALAGMPENRTLAALSAIAAGKMGSNEAMRNTARALSADEREAVAAYLAVTMPRARHPPPGTAGTNHPGGSS